MKPDVMAEMKANLLALSRAATEAGRTNGGRVDWRDLGRQFGLRLRLVRLRKRRWWVRDNGPILAFRRQDGAPVVLTPNGGKGYHLLEPGSGTDSVCSDDVAASLKEEAFMPYQTTTSLFRGVSDLSIAADTDASQQVRHGL